MRRRDAQRVLAVSGDGEYFGRYRIVRPLGEGGMGRVLLAEVVGAGGFARRVVLKLVRDELDDALKHALLEEARITATLVHRNIVPVLDLHESGAQQMVVLEYIDGMDVRELLRLARQLDWPLAAFIGGEVAAALDFAHRRQIIHRDVSPANILLSREGEVKLGDFGVAKVVGGHGGRAVGPTQGLKGKLGYMAPEQMKAQAIDPRADVYALGVVLYEMLSGKNPMRSGPIVPPPLPPSVPAELAAVVMRAVERNRDDRYGSAADVREAVLKVPGQPADPARALADFLGELQESRAGGVDEALMDAVLGGKAATRVARKTPSRRGPWIAAGAALLIVAGGAAATVRRLRVHAIAPPPPITSAAAGSDAHAAPLAQPPSVAAAETDAAPMRLPPSTVHRRQHGLLSVNAIPWANLYVDGRASGHTPRRRLTLEAGRHQLKLVNQAGESRTRTVEISPNRETTLTVVFSEP